MRKHYFKLLYLHNEETGRYYHLVVDFHKALHIPKITSVSELEEYTRICRTDTHLMNYLLQEYASYCSRLGIMSVPDD